MGDYVKNIFIILVASLLLFGCLEQFGAGTQSQATVSEGNAVPQESEKQEEVETQQTAQEEREECVPAYTFSKLEKGTLSKETVLAVSASCASGKIISLHVDDEMVAQQTISTNNPAVLNFILVPKRDGTRTIEVRANNNIVYSSQWDVAPLGSMDTSGNKNDPASVKEKIATAFDIDSGITVKRIGAYMRRLYSNTLQNSYVVAEIRADSNGNPASSHVAKTRIPITTPTMSERWVWFNFENGVTLQPGRYWVVFGVEQETENIVSDVVNIHYVAEDTTVPGNNYTRKMALEWDNNKRTYVETEWQPLSYDRRYAVVLSAIEG
ncbi:MAG: hypothetical protein QW590_01800 [Candidatus Bilamarchaeaceae archaeon]